MQPDDTDEVRSAPTAVEQLRGALPDHTHISGKTWTWTTGTGLWLITRPTRQLIGPTEPWSLSTPFGKLAFPGSPIELPPILLSVLVALGGLTVHEGDPR